MFKQFNGNLSAEYEFLLIFERVVVIPDDATASATLFFSLLYFQV